MRWQFVLVAFLLVILAIRIALPEVAARALERVMSQALNVEFTAGDVDLDVLEGWVAVEAVVMRAEGSNAVLARGARVVIDADWGALIAGELRAERIEIEGPGLFFEIDEAGNLNWDALGGPERQPSEAPPGPRKRGTFRVTSEALEIGAGTVVLVDRSQGGSPDLEVGVGALRLEEIEVGRETPEDSVRWALGRAEARDWRLGVTPIGHEALDFEFHADAGPLDDAGSLPLELNLTRKDGVELAVTGAVQPDPFAFELAVDWKGLSSRSIAPVVLRGARVARGTAHGSLVLKLDLADGPERGFKVTGNVQHDDLVLHVDDDPPIDVAIHRFVGEIDEIWFPIPAEVPTTPQPIRIDWKRIDLHEPSIDLRRVSADGATATPAEPAATSDASGGAPEETREAVPEATADVDSESGTGTGTEVEAEADEAAEPPPVPLDLRIDALSLLDGRLAWHDDALGEHSEQALSGIRLDATGVNWPPATVEHAKLVIASLGSKPLRIEGPVRSDGAELAVRGSGIKLVPWNPLISHYSEYAITGGSLSIRSDFKLAADAYEAPTTITLHRIRAITDGTGFQRTFGIPLSAATTLLSDPSGDIDLKIPVSGRLGAEGEIQIGVSLVDAMREGIMNALTSVVASPLGIAGSLVAAGRDLAFLRIGEAVFEPGAETLDQAAKDELDRAAAFVAKSPDAKLGLAAEIVAGDLEAPGASAKRPNVFRSLIVGGAALLGGRRELDSETYLLALDLAKARTQAAVDHLAAAGVLAPERIVREEWDEKIVAGSPRIVLRLDMSRGEDD